MRSIETNKLIVSQPQRLQELNSVLQTFESLSVRISERTGEDRSGDWSGTAAGRTSGQGDDTTVSARDAAIARVPTDDRILRRDLTKHIQSEAKKLEHLAERISRSNKPGTAHKLNVIYSKIRRLHIMISEILDASLEVLRRLFIRAFIDKQPIL